MSVGFCGEYNPQRHFGWCFSSVYISTGVYSVASNFRGNRIDRGPEYSSGDVVGCGIDWANRSHFFTLNGQKHGKFLLSPGS
jgi:hypothetical protein